MTVETFESTCIRAMRLVSELRKYVFTVHLDLEADCLQLRISDDDGTDVFETVTVNDQSWQFDGFLAVLVNKLESHKKHEQQLALVKQLLSKLPLDELNALSVHFSDLGSLISSELTKRTYEAGAPRDACWPKNSVIGYEAMYNP